LAEQRARKREDLLGATEAALTKLVDQTDAERQLVVAKVSSEELPLDAARITSTLRAVSAVRRALAD
jgi:hypothetical protein